MTTLTAAEKWKRTKRWLRRRFPLSRPMRVVFGGCEDKGDAGNACKIELPPRFVINISPMAPWQQREKLLHEWAHCLTWHCGDPDEHGPIWSAAVGLIYQEYLRWNCGVKAE